MSIRFPTDTVSIDAISNSDIILVADVDDSDASKDTTVLTLAEYVGAVLVGSNNAVPEPTEEGDMLISDASLNWVLSKNIDAGTY